MRRRKVWLELGIIVVGIALLAAWTRPRVEEPKAMARATPSPKATKLNTQGLRFLGRNAKGFEEYENLKDGTVLIKITGGTFTMGSDDGCSNEERPPHGVTMPTYLVGRVPVTNAQFARFISTSGYDARGDWKHYAAWGDKAPVVNLTWNDAKAYCAWGGLRLPTEEEWEFAARGTEGYTYPWGNEWDPSRLVFMNPSPGPVSIVDGHPSGASPFGCLDMVGKVYQWTSTRLDIYPGGRGTYEKMYRVLRGCSWLAGNPEDFRGWHRREATPESTYGDRGFRCARSQ